MGRGRNFEWSTPEILARESRPAGRKGSFVVFHKAAREKSPAKRLLEKRTRVQQSVSNKAGLAVSRSGTGDHTIIGQ